ncbi:MAG: YibE/F family protein, partial [Clostridia bacterium]|nr:YibE/F family protein [Clostridia bacterium]
IGTMSNTLILAYLGSSICSVLLVIYNNSFSMVNLFNKENIIVELLKILVGSFGILSALPLTSAVAALFYSKFEKFEKMPQKEE